MFYIKKSLGKSGLKLKFFFLLQKFLETWYANQHCKSDHMQVRPYARLT